MQAEHLWMYEIQSSQSWLGTSWEIHFHSLSWALGQTLQSQLCEW